jgi:hypothetical protein
MKKAHSLRINYSMNMSAALTKAWGMAKIEILETELFSLNMYSSIGGATNIIAQNEIKIHRNAVAVLESKISILKAEIFPTIKEETRIKLSTPTVSVSFCKETSTWIETVMEYAVSAKEYLDVNAYSAA